MARLLASEEVALRSRAAFEAMGEGVNPERVLANSLRLEWGQEGPVKVMWDCERFIDRETAERVLEALRYGH